MQNTSLETQENSNSEDASNTSAFDTPTRSDEQPVQERRTRTRPRHLQDHVSGEGFSDDEDEQLLALHVFQEDPISFSDAVKETKWQNAMDAVKETK